MTQLTFPNLPEAIVEHIYVGPGEQVRRGQALVLVRSERFVYEIPASASGTLRTLQVAQGDLLAAGQVLADVDEAGAALPEGLASPPVEPAVPAVARAVDHQPAATPGIVAASLRLRATPLARRIATVHALDLEHAPSDGARPLRRDDVLRLLEAGAAQRAGSPAAAVAANGGPGATVPSAVTAMEVDWSAVDDYLARHAGRRRHGMAPDRRACLVSAVAGALLRHHLAHAAWSEHGALLRRGVDIRIGERVVSHAADLSPAGVAKALAAAARPGGRPSFVIVERATTAWSEAALPPGAAAMLCAGQVAPQLRVDSNNRIAARPISIVALVYDVRLLDQRMADAFLAELRSRLERMGRLC